MLGAGSACELSWSRSAAGGPLPVTAGATRRTAVEDRLAALDSCTGSKVACAWFDGWQDRGLVNRPRTCLGHNHAASGRCGRGCRLAAACMRGSGRGLGCNGGHGGFRCRCFRANFRSGNCGRDLSAGGRGRKRLLNYGWSLCLGSRMCRRGGSGRSLDGDGRLFSRARKVFLSGGRRRLDHDNRAGNGNSACGSFGHHRTCWRTGSNGWGRR